MTDFAYNLPTVMHAVYCPKIPAEDFPKHAERGRTVHTTNYAFNPEPRADRDLALPVWHQYTRRGFPTIPPGTDMAETASWHPSLRDGLGRATGWVSPKPVQTPRTNGTFETGLWFVLPMFKPEQGPSRPWQRPNEADEERSRRHRAVNASAATGLLAVFISTDRLIDRAYNGLSISNRVHVRLYASKKPEQESLFNSTSSAPVNPRHRLDIRMGWYGRSWRLETTSTPHFEAESPRRRAALVGLAGAGLSGLTAALIAVAARARFRQERMTSEISEARDALAATEKEGEKLGRDLHDGAIQSLYAIQLGLTRTAESVASILPAASRILGDTRTRVDEVISELRKYILFREKAREESESPGLAQVLGSMVQRLQLTTAAKLVFESQGNASRSASTSQAVALTQIARTALSNSLRHAQASRIALTLRSDAGAIQFSVEDDGVGFDISKQNNGGMGLRTMRQRVADAGGTLTIDSKPGSGTRILVSLPCSAESA